MAKFSIDGTVYDWKDVTPSDSLVIPVTNGIYVGTAGTLVLTSPNGNVVTFDNVVAGICHPFGAVKIGASSDAEDIKALYYTKA